MRVGYGKLGRVIEIDPAKWGESGGDNEPPALLLTLARKHPDVTWVVVGKNSGWEPPLPNIENPWQEWSAAVKLPSDAALSDRIQRMDDVMFPTFAGLDNICLWMGQHGTSNSPIPKVEDRAEVTSPQISFVHYCSHLLRGINVWRKEDPLSREEVWLLADARNYLKARDLKWPRRHPILSQYDWSRQEWCERYGDTRTIEECGFDLSQVEQHEGKWRTRDDYVAAGLELVGIPDPTPLDEMPPWEERSRFGILINEARGYGMRPELTRLDAMKRYVLPLEPEWVYGTWTKASLEKLERDIVPMPYGEIFDQMRATKSTFTTPSSGSHWATAKPWESFATGVICFFHPLYDTQGHIVPTLAQAKGRTDELAILAQWLRVETPADLKSRVDAVHNDRDTFMWLQRVQHEHVTRALQEQRCVTTIEKRLGL